MKEHPILFSGPMVRALLDGSKVQTRRVMKPLHCPTFDPNEDRADHAFAAVAQKHPRWGFCVFGWTERECADNLAASGCCPYGRPGEAIWVRETFIAYGRWETRYSEKKKRDEWHFIDMTLECDRVYQYAAANPDVPLAKGRGATPGWWTRPAIFMPRAASRILLDVDTVRVERLNEISEADAIAEGIEPNWCGDLTKGPNGFGGEGWVPDCGWRHYLNSIDGEEAYTAVESYQTLWESINGAGSWADNPWVWVIEFKRVTP